MFANRRIQAAASFAVLLLVGCGGSSARDAAADAGALDAVSTDAVGPRDGAAEDVDPIAPDASAPDARPTDAGAEPTDAEPTDAAEDAEPADGAPADAQPMDAAPIDAAPPDATPDSGPRDVGVGCGNQQLDPGEECDDGNTNAGDGCGSNCTAEMRIEQLGASTCIPPINHAALTLGGTECGTVLSSTHIFVAGDENITTFSTPNLTNPAVFPPGAPEGPTEIFSDLRSQVAYALTTGGAPLMGQPGIADGMAVLSSGGLGAVIPLSTPLQIPSPSSRFSGWGFAVVLTAGHAQRIDLPSGVVTDLGAMSPFGAFSLCSCGVTGVAENFGNEIFLTAPDSPIATMTVIKRHRVPDGATAVVGEFDNLGYMCTFVASPWTMRWYLDWTGMSQMGGAARSVSHCDAIFLPGTSGIVPFSGIRKDRIRRDVYAFQPLRPSGGSYAFANSFIAPAQNPTALSLGAWLDSSGTVGADIRFEIWGSTAAGAPDINQPIAATPIFHPLKTFDFSYVETPVDGIPLPLVPGVEYWFVATVLGISQPSTTGQYRFARHLQNSDGLIDGGRFMFTNDPLGLVFEPTPGDAWAEMSFTVILGP